MLAETGTTLKQWIEEHPAALGERVRARFGDDLPFLFKVCVLVRDGVLFP